VFCVDSLNFNDIEFCQPCHKYIQSRWTVDREAHADHIKVKNKKSLMQIAKYKYPWLNLVDKKDVLL
jgi:hypothetical protein